MLKIQTGGPKEEFAKIKGKEIEKMNVGFSILVGSLFHSISRGTDVFKVFFFWFVP